jgi:hypothetical protein
MVSININTQALVFKACKLIYQRFFINTDTELLTKFMAVKTNGNDLPEVS